MRHLPDKRLYHDTQYCLDFARAVTPSSPPAGEPIIFHFYWRGGVSRKIVFALNSFLVTQDLSRSIFWLWIDASQPGHETTVAEFQRLFGSRVAVKPFDALKEATGTPLEGDTELLGAERPAAASDAMRLVVLYRYGGMYIDADTMALRDFQPLLRSDLGRGEFGYRWSNTTYATNAIARGHKGSALGLFLLERAKAIRICHQRLLLPHDAGIPDDFLELPCSFFDPLWLHFDRIDRFAARPFSRFRDFFRPFGLFHRRSPTIKTMGDFFPGAFAYQWHGLWSMEDRVNSYFGLFEAEINKRLAALPR